MNEKTDRRLSFSAERPDPVEVRHLPNGGSGIQKTLRLDPDQRDRRWTSLGGRRRGHEAVP